MASFVLDDGVRPNSLSSDAFCETSDRYSGPAWFDATQVGVHHSAAGPQLKQARLLG